MRVLFVAMANSIHTSRWVDQLAGQGWDLHLFPSTDSWVEIHPQLGNVTLHHTGFRNPARSEKGVRFRGVSLASRVADVWQRRVLKEEEGTRRRAERLARLVARLAPDIVHSLEIQHAGYLTWEARQRLGKPFPPWIVTNWGSDIYLYGRLAEHAPKIRNVLAGCDYYSCECLRDVSLAKSFGFAGTVLPVFPNAGGFDLTGVERLRQPGSSSSRRAIMLKGYQHWGGRALTGLRALERCADLLGGYEVWIYSATPDVAVAAELFAESTGIRVELLPKGTSHPEILSRHGRARISIGLSISDAISTSLLEAMMIGVLPDPVVDGLCGRMDRGRAHGVPCSSGRPGGRGGGDPQRSCGRRVGRPRGGGESPDRDPPARPGADPTDGCRDLHPSDGGCRGKEVAAPWEAPWSGTS